MGTVKQYQELRVWRSAMEMAVSLHHVTLSFPRDELFGLTSQIRRAAVSVPSNIAEGASRVHSKEYLHHLSMAQGSLAELETQIILAVRFDYLSKETSEKVMLEIASVGKQLNALRKSLRNISSTSEES